MLSPHAGTAVRRGLVAGSLALLVASSPALAQTIAADRLRAAASIAKDLQFPDGPSALSLFSTPGMAIYKPEGNGPFPALVLLHQCGGLRNNNTSWANASMLAWAKEAVARGYVAFVVDSLGPRGVDTVCYGPKGGINPIRGARDAFQAAEHLHKFDFVDRKRIALAGYSWGAMVAVFASSQTVGTTFGTGDRIAAFVSLYPWCATLRPPSGSPYEVVNPDIDRPLLVLMGDKDNETPPEECISRLEKARASGAPVEWHLYPGATHCWDCENLHGFRKVDVRNNSVVYYYDRAATQDSAKRMFDFLNRAMPAR